MFDRDGSTNILGELNKGPVISTSVRGLPQGVAWEEMWSHVAAEVISY